MGGRVTRPRLSICSSHIVSFRSSELAGRLPEAFRTWKEVVKDYSTRSMTNQNDKLAALSGIVSFFPRATNDVYLAGLWKRHLLHELSRKLSNAQRPNGWRAPSWSWMALGGPVMFQADRCQWYGPVTDVVSCEVTSTFANAPYSRVTEGTLVLEGRLGSIPKTDCHGYKFPPNRPRQGEFVLDCEEDHNGDVDASTQILGPPQYWFFRLARCFTNKFHK